VISALACLLPYFLGFEPIDTDVSTVGYKDAMSTVIVALSCAFPIALDTLLDSKHPDSVMLPRWTHLLTMLIPNGLLYCLPRSPVLLVGCSFARELLIRGALMSHMFNDPEFFSTYYQRIFGFTMALFALDLNIRTWYCTLHSVIPRYIYRLTTGMVGLSFLMVIYVIIQKTISTYELTEKATKSTVKGMPGYRKYCHYYTILLLISMTAKVAIRYTVMRTSFATISDAYLLYGPLNLCDVFVSVVAALIPLHVLRHDKTLAEEYSQTVYTLKASFLSYIYREMRCNLRTLQHIVSQSINSEVFPLNDFSIMASWNEFYGVCAMSNSLLDEIILLDDVNSGNKRYHKERANSRDILSNAIAPLEFKAKQADVKLSYDEIHCPPSSSGSDGLLVYADVQALTIALRTLVEYSIGHASPGTYVDVSISHSENESNAILLANKSTTIQKNMICVSILFHCEHKINVPLETTEDHIFGLGNASSSGIGLAAVADIVQKHNGTFSLIDRPVPRYQILLPCAGLNVSNTIPLRSGDTQDDEPRQHSECSMLSEQDNTGQKDGSDTHAEANSVNTEHRRVVLSEVYFPCAVIVSPVNSPDASVIREALCDHVQVVKEVHSESQIVEYISNHCTWSKPISIIFLHRGATNKKPHVLTSKWRKMGYDGVIVLISDMNYPDSNERFLACGGNAVLLCALSGDRLVRRVDVEEVLVDAFCLNNQPSRPLSIKCKKISPPSLHISQSSKVAAVSCSIDEVV